MDEAWLTIKKAEMLEILCELNGAIALNTYRAARDETIAYDEDHFEDLAARCRSIQQDIWKNR